MSIAAQTVADLNRLAAGTPETMVGFKARIAVRTAKNQLFPGVINLAQQPTPYQTVIAQAIVNESNR